MPDESAKSFRLGPFLVRAALWAVAAGALWQITREQNAALTVWLTKLLHRIAGFPAPYLFADDSHLYWHATMFPPVVALTLASYWRSWPTRIIDAIVGYIVQCCINTVAITLNESPYIQSVDMLSPIISTLVNANYLVIGVAIWVLLAGPWYKAPPRKTSDGPAQRAWRGIYYSGVVRVLLLWLGITLIVPAAAMFGSQPGRSARWEIAKAMREVPYFPHPSRAEMEMDQSTQDNRDRLTSAALRAVQNAIESDMSEGREVGALWHLAGHLFVSLNPADARIEQQFNQSAITSLQNALRQGRR